ncbi:dithiol-disulfide isomerase [Chryseobacterium sp. CBo1]|uniref:ClpXP adapter SpxH family protein n=1 Tax=Chryseobacterium sp. CBo1 TaxID=1869230 RepID=UPI0008107FA3|nr:ClpXP adapter SpxH family protein [Chryseobacterium sp. CBo1]OCK50046.1 dithiol-disulfide isomerase [Chryseobacterium sp. CBo1]
MTTDSLNNPLICDPTEGVCGVPENNDTVKIKSEKSDKPVKIVYFTDPICSSCWGIEPQLRKLKLEYGNDIEIDYRMGGLLPDWSYNSGGISKPSDVAHHWDEVSLHYEMPIDGDVWLEDPLDSSYPPSIAFKAAQIQSKEKAVLLMREMREMLFLNKKNIAKWEHIATAAERVGLDVTQLKTDFEGSGKILFDEDLKLAKENGVRGFPSIFFMNDSGNKEMIYGTKPYPFYETAVLKMFPNAKKKEYSKNWESLFEKYPSLTAKEFAELSGLNKIESEKKLDDLFVKGKLKKLTTKNGSLWTVKVIEE